MKSLNQCYHCGKTVLYGRTHTHHRGVAGGRWKKRAPKKQRIFRVNFVRLSIIENGIKKRIKLCAKCLKRVKKDTEEGRRPFLTLQAPISNQQDTKKSQITNPKHQTV